MRQVRNGTGLLLLTGWAGLLPSQTQVPGRPGGTLRDPINGRSGRKCHVRAGFPNTGPRPTARVTAVQEGGQAYIAGVAPGDVIYRARTR
jgi:hypothetical protein